MSRKGKVPILLPKGVEVNIKEKVVALKGPKGTISQEVGREIDVSVKEGKIIVQLHPEFPEASNLHGLYWALIANMVTGVSQGFEKKLEMVGVGFRSQVVGNHIELQVGFSHPTRLPIPEGIKVAIDKGTMIAISGVNKQQVGQFAADVRSKYPPEPYKGKGIRYVDEYVRRKAGKAAKK